MRRILIVTSNLNIGGAQRFIVNFANDLFDTHEVNVLTIQKNKKPNLFGELNNKIKYKCLNSRALLSILDLRSKMLEFKPDVIFSTQSYVNNVVILAKVISGIKTKLVIREASIISNYRNPIYWLSKISYRFTDKIVAQTEEIKLSIQDHYWVKPDKVQIIPNYIDHELLKKKADVEEVKIGSKKRFIFLFCGRLHKVKNVNFLINALAEIYLYKPEFDFWILGDGEEREDLEEIKCDKNLDFIKFLGFQKNPYPFMKRADCILLASDYEGFPNVIIEAMALDTVAVINNFGGGASSLIIPDNSSKFKFNNKNDFINIIYSLLMLSQKELDELKQKFYSKSLDYSKKYILNHYIK